MNTKSKEGIFKDFAQFVSPGKAAFFQQNGLDFVFGRREGSYIWDVDESRRLIDCHCNGGVFNFGHRNPALIDCLKTAMASLDIGNHHFVSAARARLAKKLAELTPGDLHFSIFGVSGGEAVDAAIKVARKATQRRQIISIFGGYHGHTGLAVAAGDEKFAAPFLADSPDFVQVPFNDLSAMEKAVSEKTAAVLLETIPATLGMAIPHNDYLLNVKKICRKKGALLILDEIQAGLGRTGKLWGFEHWAAAPDILVIGKGLSGGLYPITATVIRDDLIHVFEDDPFSHISTFGGAEIGCEVALRVLQMTSDETLLRSVEAIAQYFNRRFSKLASEKDDLLPEFRQKGLMIGLKFSSPELGPAMTKACFEAGLLCVFAANDPSVVQFLPPLNTTLELAEEIMNRLLSAIGYLTKEKNETVPVP